MSRLAYLRIAVLATLGVVAVAIKQIPLKQAYTENYDLAEAQKGPFAGRINHFTVKSNPGDGVTEALISLGLSHSTFPQGWPTETLQLSDSISFNTTGFWLGNTVVESVTSDYTGFPSTWIDFDPKNVPLVDKLEDELEKRGISVNDTKQIVNSRLLYRRFQLEDFPRVNAHSAVQFTYTPALSVLPLDYTYLRRAPQGSIGLLRVEALIWGSSAVQDSVSKWEDALNIPASSDCMPEVDYCFSLSSDGIEGPSLNLKHSSGNTDGKNSYEGLESVVISVASLNKTLSALEKVIKHDWQIDDYEYAVELGSSLKLRFVEDHEWQGYWSYACNTISDKSFCDFVDK